MPARDWPERARVTAGWFFSSRRRHTSYWRDWSSDVCSSDLGRGRADLRHHPLLRALAGGARHGKHAGGRAGGGRRRLRDRKRVVEGKRVDLGGRRIIKKKNIRPCCTAYMRREDLGFTLGPCR